MVRESMQKECFGGQVWTNCGSTMTASCDDPEPGPKTNDPCVPRCKCPSTRNVMYHGTCIKPQHCTAKYCRGARFHTNRQMCCNGVVANRPRDFPGCCGNRSYTMATHECVGRQIRKRPSRKTGCIGGLVWTTCGRICTPTCDDPAPSCSGDCVKRCHCPSNQPIFYQGECIRFSECPVKRELLSHSR
ncbi:hypothetical protein NP493_798g04017 [Ridgeia piscesae]|uniref:TIL domain-containing protein n=1 Tax=Ridgeia piscesae TaxID=27915 RepID=A0AAD9KND9_RIDPI|nr:hypothetical protein NP493_798g04017 [Ridgeia piscesae]